MNKEYEEGYLAGLRGEVDDGSHSKSWLEGYSRAYEEGERKSVEKAK